MSGVDKLGNAVWKFDATLKNYTKMKIQVK